MTVAGMHWMLALLAVSSPPQDKAPPSDGAWTNLRLLGLRETFDGSDLVLLLALEATRPVRIGIAPR